MELDYNTLSLSRDGKTVYISVEITNGDGENATIDRISIDTSDTYVGVQEQPSSKAISMDFGSTEATWEYTDDNFVGKLLFVWVAINDGTGVITYYKASLVSWYQVYCMAMSYVKTLNCNGCNPPMDFIDFILKTKGIDYALHTGNYTQAIKLWNTLVPGEAKNMEKSPCGCN